MVSMKMNKKYPFSFLHMLYEICHQSFFSLCENCKTLVKLQCVIVIYVVIPYVIVIYVVIPFVIVVVVVAMVAVIVVVIDVVVGYPTKEDQGYIFPVNFVR